MDFHEGSQDILHKLTAEFTHIQRHELRQQLIEYINFLLLHDFSKLVQLLYKVDVNESKLKAFLQEDPHTDSAVLIADLLIERQAEKIKTKTSTQEDKNISDEDKW